MVCNSGDRNGIITPPRIVGCNAESDGSCRTIKASYFKTGRVNFQYHNDWGATGVMVVYETE